MITYIGQGIGGPQTHSCSAFSPWNQVCHSYGTSAYSQTWKFHWAWCQEFLLGVSLHKYDWLDHWPHDWTQSLVPLLPSPEFSLAESPNTLITWWFFLVTSPLPEPSLLSLSSDGIDDTESLPRNLGQRLINFFIIQHYYIWETKIGTGVGREIPSLNGNTEFNKI